MITDKIHIIKRSRLNKNDIKLIDLFNNLQLKKHKKGIYYIIYRGDIYFEIDTHNNILWCNYDLLIKHYKIEFNKNINLFSDFQLLKEESKKFIFEYFNMNVDYDSIFAFTPTTKRYYYLGSPKRNKNIFLVFDDIICFFNKNNVSL